MNKIDALHISLRKMRDRRVDSLWEDLRSVPFKGYLSVNMLNALLLLIPLFVLIGGMVSYLQSMRLEVVGFFGVQWYLVLCSLLLLMPFWQTLVLEGIKQAVLMVKHKKSRFLRFALLLLFVYGVLLLLNIGIIFFEANPILRVAVWHLPGWGSIFHRLYRVGADEFYGIWIGCTVGGWVVIEVCQVIAKQYYQFHYRTTFNVNAYPFGLWLGKTTGMLSRLSHGAGMPGGKEISLSWQDASQNIIILGGIGSGKTTQLIHPLLGQFLDQNCGGLIFDIKGNFGRAVKALSDATGYGSRLFVIGPEHLSINLIEGLTPEIAASFLKSCLMLGGGTDMNQFFTDTATELCRISLGVLSFIPEAYNLYSLYRYIFDESYLQSIHKQIDAYLVSNKWSEDALALLKSYRRYREQTFDQFDEKLRGSILASVAHILSPFNHPELIRAFCQTTQCHLEQVLEGSVFLVQLPLSRWGLGGKVANNFIKLRFFNVMQQRELRQEWDQEKLVFFMCDEYQEIVSGNRDGLSDLNFWDKSRSSKTIGIISSQSIKSFYAAVGNRDCADAILQNFRQKLCFRTEDQETLDYLNRLTGRVEVEKVTESRQLGSSSGTGRSHRSRTKTTTKVERAVLDPQLIRNLAPSQAVALLIIDGYSRDDVLNTQAIYL